jgi:DNA repair protein RadC
MKNEKYAPSDFRHLAKSLIKFFKMSQESALYYVSCWFRLHVQTLTPPNSNLSPVSISSELLMSGRPYHTEIQLYRSLESLRQTFVGAEVNRYDEPVIQQINKLVHEIRDAFFAKHRIEIDDPETVYSICREHLVPDSSEPMQIMYDDHMEEILRKHAHAFYGDCYEGEYGPTEVDTKAHIRSNSCQHCHVCPQR